MVNVIFNDFSYEVLPRQLETWDKYCKIIQWGRANPTRFLEDFIGMQFTDHQKYVLLSSWLPANVVWVCSRSTGKSFMSAPLIMARSLLIPSHNTYIMGPTGSQAQETFSKMENLAKNNIASVIGVSSVFLDETVRINSKADPFVHDKNSYHVELYNGSTVNTLNSVATNIVGIRRQFNVYDEAVKITREFFALTLPFTVQNADFRMGGTLNAELYPKQLQNKNLLCSSAEGIDSELFDRYKIAFNRMLMGDPEYFVCDLDCSHSLHPFLNGKPAPPLVTQDVIDDAFKTNPYRATREYYNRFDSDGGEDVFVKRSVLNKFSVPMEPVFKNDGTKKYIVSYDPASRVDNSIIAVAELFYDEERGYMCKFVNCINLVEILKNGEKTLIQKPEQIERLKNIILDYNRGALDYENIDMLIIDAGAGGGGGDIAQFLMNEWIGKDRKMHLGFIDKDDPYMALREDDYPANKDNLRMFNFKRDKVQAYERAQNAINQGLVIFPASLNARNEIEFEDEAPDGSVRIRYEKANGDELNALVQMDLAKEELVGMQKIKKPNGTIQFELSADAKSRGAHDDRADAYVMILDRLMEIRANEALIKETPKEDFKKVFSSRPVQKKNNPFGQGPNPFFRGRNVM